MKRKGTKISRALEYMKTHPKASAYEAAQSVRLSPTSLYKKLALEEAKARGVCPCCGKKL